MVSFLLVEVLRFQICRLTPCSFGREKKNFKVSLLECVRGLVPCVLGDEFCGDGFWGSFFAFLDEFQAFFQGKDSLGAVGVVASWVL
jgi:hypothetical protein